VHKFNIYDVFGANDMGTWFKYTHRSKIVQWSMRLDLESGSNAL